MNAHDTRHFATRLAHLAAAALILAFTPAGTGTGHAQAGPDQSIDISLPGGSSASAVLRVPDSPARPPIVLLVAPAAGTELAAALAARGVATLRMSTAPASAEPLAHAIAFLRNDERFPTVSVLAASADAATTEAAIVAARAARADGVLTRSTATKPLEQARLVAPIAEVTGTSIADDADRIATFVRTVPALGRRGTKPTRPDTKRASPRRTVLATIDGVRVSIEWGAPQKRGRDIWGALVPWNNIWMPGADEATTLTTNGPITIGALQIPAGDHTFYLFPASDRVELIVSKDVGQFHTVRNPELELGRVPLTLATRTEVVEGLTFAIDAPGAAATLKLTWDTREYSAPIARK